MDITIILAAGEGTRMKSNKSKVLHKLLNHDILEYVVDAANISDNAKTIVIAGENEKQIKEKFENLIIKRQHIGKEYPYGTGYAVSLAINEIEDNDNVIVLNGDIPLLTRDSLVEFIKLHKDNNNSASVLSTVLDDPTTYGRIVRENNEFERIVEEKDASCDVKKIKEINTGIYAFKGVDLKEALSSLNTQNSQGELYLTDCIEIIKNNSKKVGCYTFYDPNEFYGINNKYELSRAEIIMQERINKKFMIDGVIMHNPSMIRIDKDAKIGKDTEIYPGACILGKSVIGENCIIKGSSRIDESIIEDNVIIDNSVIEKSHVESGVDIGPFSHLRPKAYLKENVHIGNFVEVKNATVGENTKAGHLAYIGDADLGKNINVGCGVIFVNYDGKFKHRSTIEDGAFIGSNANIVAPVLVEKEGYIAAGSTITNDVGSGMLSIERASQKNIEGYVEKKKKGDKLKEEK